MIEHERQCTDMEVPDIEGHKGSNAEDRWVFP